MANTLLEYIIIKEMFSKKIMVSKKCEFNQDLALKMIIDTIHTEMTQI